MRNRMKPSLTFLGQLPSSFRNTTLKVGGTTLLAGVVLSSLVACGSKWHEVSAAPRTADPFAEKQIAQQPPAHVGDPGFVSTPNLPARQTVEQPPEKAPAHLETNDKIQVVNNAPEGDTGSVEVVVTQSGQPDMVGQKVFVDKKYISDKPVVPSNEDNDREKYFMIQNIATEMVRVYRNCESKDASGNCINKLVFETPMTAGEDTPDKTRRTMLGSYRISKWFKFYEDHAHYFPSFYAPGYPKTPDRDANAELKDWMSPSLLPAKGGVMRGSFGWYTAYLSPEPTANQWTHGTFGWGKDGDKFIQIVKDPNNSLVMDVRSQGCTRVENQAIALMREILPVGTRLIKVYAREGYADAKLTRYQVSGKAKWNWVLTKKLGADAPKSTAKLAQGVGADEILDHGSYVVDQMPTAVKLNSSVQVDATHENGNVYGVPEADMKGVLLVDEGRLVGYEHPKELKVGGLPDHKLPSVSITTEQPAAEQIAPVSTAPPAPAAAAKPQATAPAAASAPASAAAPAPAKPTTDDSSSQQSPPPISSDLEGVPSEI